MKAICTIWDFTDLETRFVTRDHSGLSLPGGWTQFDGCVQGKEGGSTFDLNRGTLTVGEIQFMVPDVDQDISAWLKSNDISLSNTPVVKKEGFVGEAESTYGITYWNLEDYSVGGREGGGGYVLKLANIFKALTKSVFEDIEGGGIRFGGTFSLTTTDTVKITLAESVPTWRAPGYVMVCDEDAKTQELIRYETIAGGANNELTTLTRCVHGVGGSAGTGTAFANDDAEVFPVWFKRGNPFHVMLELMTTTDAGADPTTLVEFFNNPGFDDWTASLPDGWSLSGDTANVSEDTTEALFGSALQYDFDSVGGGGDELLILQNQDGFDADKWYRLAILYKATSDITDHDAGSGEQAIAWKIRNLTRSENWVPDTETWDNVGTGRRTLGQTIDTQWRWAFIPFKFKTGWSNFDSVNFFWIIQQASAGDLFGTSVFLDTTRSHLQGPFDSKPNGPYDVGTGDGLGALVDWGHINTVDIEELVKELHPLPVFDSNDEELVSGDAVFFVEKDPIKDLKDFIEGQILRPFGMKPATDSEEKFSMVEYYEVPPPDTVIGDEWLKEAFRPTTWKRNYGKRINQIRLCMDFDVQNGDCITALKLQQDRSVDQYGKSKIQTLECRGARNGKFGFPDFSSVDDLTTAASRILLETANPWTSLKLRVFYAYRGLSLKEAVRLNIPGVLNLSKGIRGIDTDTLFFVDKKVVDSTKGFVELTVRERRPVFRPAFVGPNTQPSTYTAATESERQFCFLTPNDESTFANGDEGYTVV